MCAGFTPSFHKHPSSCFLHSCFSVDECEHITIHAHAHAHTHTHTHTHTNTHIKALSCWLNTRPCNCEQSGVLTKVSCYTKQSQQNTHTDTDTCTHTHRHTHSPKTAQ